MSQRTRLKKMSLGAALILGTVSVSNFAEATGEGSNSLEGGSSDATNLSAEAKPELATVAREAAAAAEAKGLGTESRTDEVSVNSVESSVAEAMEEGSNSSERPSSDATNLSEKDNAALATVAREAEAVAAQKALGAQVATEEAAAVTEETPVTGSGANKVSVNSGVDEKESEISDASRSEALPGSAGSLEPVRDDASVNSAGSSVAETVANTSNSSDGPSDAMNPSAKDKAALATVAREAAAVVNQKALGRQVATEEAAAVTEETPVTGSGANKVSVNSVESSDKAQTPSEEESLSKKSVTNDVSVKSSDTSISRNAKVSTGPSERVGGNASGNSAGSSGQSNKPIRTPGDPFKYDSSRTFGQWFDDLTSRFESKSKTTKSMSSSTYNAKRTPGEWLSDLVKVMTGNLGKVFGNKVSEGMAQEDPSLFKSLKNQIRKSNVANQEDLGRQAATEEVIQKNLKAKIDAEAKKAAEELDEGNPARIGDFFRKSERVIKQYRESKSQKAKLKKTGYNDDIIEELSVLNGEARRAIAEFKAREENRKNEDETEDDVAGNFRVEGGE